MQLSKNWQPADVEGKWYDYWLSNKFFSSKPDNNKEPYVVVIPPPNVTGVLHMGHMLNNTIQDVLIRRARMQGKEACWVPGTDHASIATEARVVAMLKEQGIDKKSIGRDEFLKHAWDWKEKYGGIILQQLKKLGASCDWDRTRFTMEEKLSAAVIEVFVDLYNKGLIYRGVRMVNWDPAGLTALSDEEVYHKEVQSKLVYINYPLTDGSGAITIATTRPETIMADVAVCVNPNDERYQHLVGKTCLIPLINKEIPIIADDYITIDFGTGCLKVTPAHDINDFELGQRHNLEVIDILNEDGTLNEKARIYVGRDRFAVRKEIVAELQEKGFVAKVEEITNAVGLSERTHAVVEPRLSMQWFLKMTDISKPALEAVMNDEVKLHPSRFKNTYRVWMENVRDWCISRQLWWGQRIPAFYLPDGSFVVAVSAEKALGLAKAKNPSYTAADLRQDDDVLDTWFSSWLWPISVFDGFDDPNNEDINYYYPTNDLVTAPEILFFWVARMIIAGYEYKQAPPFKNVYLTGIVRDKQGRKMSKSLGNSPDPLDLIDKYGADGVRTGMLFSSPAGNDLPFDEKLCEQGRNFCNKIWNALKLVKGWQVDDALAQPKSSALAVTWMQEKLNAFLLESEDLYSKFRISEVLLAGYRLVWEDFCAWYLEMVKPAFGEPIDNATYQSTIELFEAMMKVMHPFMPFITEEVWHSLSERADGQSICISTMPVAKGIANTALLADAEVIFELVSQIRNTRSGLGKSPKESLELQVITSNQGLYTSWSDIIVKLANTSAIHFVSAAPGSAKTFVIKGDNFFIPVEEQEGGSTREDLEKELEYVKGFLASVEAKLSNEKFVANAKPELVERERVKQADALSKIKAIEQILGA